MQTGLYATAGGQPAYDAAWTSREVNAFAGDFFTATRRTIDQAFLRPRVAGHRRFQVLAGELIHRFIWQDTMTAGKCIAEFGRLVGLLLADSSNANEQSTAGAA
jgi:multiple sugar transport system substrate-binding protein